MRAITACRAALLILLSASCTTLATAQDACSGKLALVLSGGGAKGLAHIGVLRILDSLGIHPDLVVGTSMGAIVGAMYASGYTPAQIEDLAQRSKAIARAAAFAIADERLGERVCLAIIPAPGAALDAAAALRHLHEAGLSKYDMPEYFIAMAEFPLTASGKVLKRELALWAKTGRIQPKPCRWVDPAKQGAA